MITVQVPKGFSSKEHLPNSAEWIPWTGGECPVPDGTKVEAEWRGGGSDICNAKFIYWKWDEDDPETDILRYRVIKEESKDDGWIQWEGGDCPVPDGTRVEVELRGGGSTIICDAKFVYWKWDEDDTETDIVRYRVISQGSPKGKSINPRSVQVGGTHYAEMKIQPWDAINVWSTPEMVLGYHVNTAVSYLARFRAKGGLQDIKKAHHHLSELIRYFEEEEEYPF